MTYYDTEREFHIYGENNMRILFDLESDIASQVEKLIVFHKEEKDLTQGGIVYIDLRVKNKIFYCEIDEEYQCIQNLSSVYSQL